MSDTERPDLAPPPDPNPWHVRVPGGGQVHVLLLAGAAWFAWFMWKNRSK